MLTDTIDKTRPRRCVLDETRLKVSDAAKLVPGRSGKHPTRQTLHRWRTVGILVNGVRVHLEMRRVGSTWWTSKEAVQRWLEATNPTTPAGA